MKKIIFVVIALLCVFALVGCSQTQAQASTASASQEAASSAAPLVSAAASGSAAASESAPASSAAASASKSLVGASGSALTPAYVDAFNKEMATKMASTGQTIVMSVSGNTVTLTVTMGQDIDASTFPSSMQAQYNKVLQEQIDAVSTKNPDMPSCTWVYILQNKSGQQLMKLTANYTAK